MHKSMEDIKSIRGGLLDTDWRDQRSDCDITLQLCSYEAVCIFDTKNQYNLQAEAVKNAHP